jgi:hypothetical protein
VENALIVCEVRKTNTAGAKKSESCAKDRL